MISAPTSFYRTFSFNIVGADTIRPKIFKSSALPTPFLFSLLYKLKLSYKILGIKFNAYIQFYDNMVLLKVEKWLLTLQRIKNQAFSRGKDGVYV